MFLNMFDVAALSEESQRVGVDVVNYVCNSGSGCENCNCYAL